MVLWVFKYILQNINNFDYCAMNVYKITTGYGFKSYIINLDQYSGLDIKTNNCLEYVLI